MLVLILLVFPCILFTKVWCFGKWGNSIFSSHPKKNITQNETFQHGVFLFNTEINYIAATSHTFPVTFREEGREKRSQTMDVPLFRAQSFICLLGVMLGPHFKNKKEDKTTFDLLSL